MDIEELHKTACLNRQTFYIDPTIDMHVMTEYAHLKRGTCCGRKCRHCPYGHKNVKK